MWVVDETLGARIRQARLAAGITQSDLAESIDVSDTTIRNWESDLTKPRPDLAARLGNRLGIDLGDTPQPPRLVAEPVSDTAPTRGKRRSAPRLDSASKPQMYAELHARDAHEAEQLRAARERIADLEAEVTELRAAGLPGIDQARRRFAARDDEDMP